MARGNIDLKGQTAIITGGGGGIGRGIALALAGAGADIVIADIITERCEEVAEKARAMGVRALAFPTDMADTGAIERMVDATKAEFGRIDILINNAGGTAKKPFIEQSERSWRRHIDLNLISMFAATSAAVPVMIAGGRGGSIVNVSSIEGSRAAPLYAVYAACKAGMNNFTRTMALELADHGIRVNAIAPDFTDTPGTRGIIGGSGDPETLGPIAPMMEATIADRIPLARAGHIDECGDAALFLASDMARYITGVTLPVDGGSWASSGWVRDKSGQWILSEPRGQ